MEYKWDLQKKSATEIISIKNITDINTSVTSLAYKKYLSLSKQIVKF